MIKSKKIIIYSLISTLVFSVTSTVMFFIEVPSIYEGKGYIKPKKLVNIKINNASYIQKVVANTGVFIRKGDDIVHVKELAESEFEHEIIYYRVIKAPFDGYILSGIENKYPGMFINKGANIIQFSSSDNEVVLNVKSEWLSEIEINDSVIISPAGQHKRYKGKISSISYDMNAIGVNYYAIATLERHIQFKSGVMLDTKIVSKGKRLVDYL